MAFLYGCYNLVQRSQILVFIVIFYFLISVTLFLADTIGIKYFF